MTDFLAMGGYAPWVWGAWGAVAALVIGMGIATRRRLDAARSAARRAHGRHA